MLESTPLTHPKLSDNDYDQYLKIISDGLSKPTTKAHVIIIGAGIAGITAAFELTRAGHEITLLEASHRAGGRIFTMREPFSNDLYGEAGAMRYPPSHHLLMRYLKKFNLKTESHPNSNPNGFFYFNGQKQRVGMVLQGKNQAPTRVMNKWRIAVQPLEDYYRTELSNGNNVWPDLIKQYNEYSLRDFLIKCSWDESEIDLFGKMGLGLGGYSSIMNCSFLEIFRLFLVDNDKNQNSIVGGSDTLINAFLDHHFQEEQPRDKLADKITFGAVVKKVIQLNDNLIVEYENMTGKHRILGDYVICTAPFPMVRFIDFEPGLSAGKQRAINELHYFSSTKIFLQTKTRFWESKKNHAKGLTLTDLPIRSLYFPEQNANDNRGVMIASYTWEKESQLWEALPEEQRIKKAVDYVSKIFPEIRTEFELGATISWNDPKYFTGGAFSIFAPGQMASLYNDIVKAEGKIHFAGEHTSFEHGWVEGAIESGLREAEAITQELHKRSRADNADMQKLKSA
jgi:monoamine oxidase